MLKLCEGATENALGFVERRDCIHEGAEAPLDSEEVGLHLELIGEEMHPAQVELSAAADRFRGPMDANCILFDGKVVCRYAYQELVPTHIEARATCDAGTPATHAGAWLLQVPPGGRVDPVVNETVPLQARICAGDPVTFTEYGSRQRFHLVLDVSSVRLMDYQARD